MWQDAAAINKMRIPTGAHPVVLADLLNQLLGNRNLFNMERAKEIPATLSCKAVPNSPNVLPKQTPKQENISLCDPLKSESSWIGAVISVCQVIPVRVGMRLWWDAATEEGKRVGRILLRSLGGRSWVGDEDPRAISKDRTASSVFVAHVGADID